MGVESDLTSPSNGKDQFSLHARGILPTTAHLVQIPKTLNLRSEGRVQDSERATRTKARVHREVSFQQ